MGEGKGESVTDISMQRELRQGPRLAWQSLFIWVVFNVSKQPCQQCLAGFLAHVHTDSFMFMKDGWRWRHSLVAQGGPTCSLSNRAELCWHSYVVLLSFAEQASSSKSEFKNFWKRKEKKKHLTSTARGHLAHLPASWGHTTAESIPEQTTAWILQRWDDLRSGGKVVQKQSHLSPLLLCLSFFSKHYFGFMC